MPWDIIFEGNEGRNWPSFPCSVMPLNSRVETNLHKRPDAMLVTLSVSQLNGLGGFLGLSNLVPLLQESVFLFRSQFQLKGIRLTTTIITFPVNRSGIKCVMRAKLWYKIECNQSLFNLFLIKCNQSKKKKSYYLQIQFAILICKYVK